MKQTGEVESADAAGAETLTGPGPERPPARPAPGDPDPLTSTVAAPVPAALRLWAAAPASPEMELQALPPSLHERYQISALLGSGGMGAVYRARDRQLERDVALKLLFHHGDGRGGRALQEARAQARLDHENACKVFDVGASDGVWHLAMQYIDGEPLSVACQRMTLEEKVRIVRQVAPALHEAHRIGLVHRDVKPSNIMVERREDGSEKPYLMDFGIAREAGAEGQTASGVIAGTPAYMAPEQARGEIHALDRRTDVYGLGATLFDILAGRPPFTAPGAGALLHLILGDEAPPLRKVSPDVPVDLEAIVARCLEKAPHRRYESAKALGEDLQRFLDGDPVQARRLSRGYLLVRAARKHKAVVALAGAAVVAALVVAGLGVRERRLAAERADLARELGEDVKEMEMSLRIAFGLPLHDIERDKDAVRARLAGVEARMARAGPAGEGPGHYALGRGYLALQEPEEARAHLVRAEAAGYASADLDYALGLALGELHAKALEETKRIESPEAKKARVEEIKAKYEEPALRHLRASLGARREAPEYVEGLIALHEGRPEEALAKAREASAARPWFYEAKQLEGDAHFAMGSRFRHDAAFDYDRMMVDFRAAAEAYAGGAQIARSDPRVHEAECELWAQIMRASIARSEPLRPSYEKARAACGRAIIASSRSDRGHLELASLQASFAWWIVTGASPEDPEEVVKEALALAEDAMRRSPKEPMAPYVMAKALRAEARYRNDRGLDSRASVDRAITSFEQAIRLDPTFLWAVNDLSFAYSIRAENDEARGLDPAASLEKCLEQSRRAHALDPGFLYAYSSENVAHLLMAEHLVDSGRDPARELATWRDAIAAERALSRDWPWADYFTAYASWLEARHALASGGDPSAPLDRGTRDAAEFLKRSQSVVDASLMSGKLGLTRALHLLARGEDPGPALRGAAEALQRCVEAAPWDVSLRVLRARADITGLRWAAEQRTLAAGSFDAATAPLLPLLDRERVDPRLYQALAEVREIEAAWLLERGKSADEAVTMGLEMAARALALNPRMARAFATQGALLLVRARATRDPAARGRAARSAEEALSLAVRYDPLLEWEVGPLLRKTRPLVDRRD